MTSKVLTFLNVKMKIKMITAKEWLRSAMRSRSPHRVEKSSHQVSLQKLREKDVVWLKKKEARHI